MQLSTNTSHEQIVQRKHPVIFLLGGPGSGKGTLVTNLQKKIKLEAFSVGDLLRTASQDLNNPDHETIHKCITEGSLVPVDISLQVILLTISSLKTNHLVVIDGFPRNCTKAAAWLKHKELTATTNLLGIIHLLCDIRELRRRAGERGRTDDNEAVLEKRIGIYKTKTVEAITYLKSNGAPIWEVDANKTPQIVAESAIEIINEALVL